ncbi:FG-GAP-like repeat-containing protein [Streptomyces ficellus]|uniref:FG-GAP-like repeat-containing protein n=1 Tax=Streptomyces ficellus TaxID=1977088 RepID=A0ABT7ZEF4_9ACTN|nr:FG-GAP-like repeat-containing protein [Streptomyces ficellus]MDN3297884.1 FG-GAP-like repeat-containing protein [Streptomyces ficellus]
MSALRPRAAAAAALTAAAVTAGVLAAVPAQAVSGAPVADNAYAFTAKLVIGEGDKQRACSGALVEAGWVLTAASCFADGTTQAAPGKPALKTVATIGRADLSATTGGHVSEVVELAPRADRDLVMARLAQPATGIAPVAMATTPVAKDDTLKVAGYGRTKTEWVPNKLHTAAFGVDAVTGTGLSITGKTAGDAICKGDTGGPVLREANGRTELVGVSSRSWQGGCLGESETRNGAVATRIDNITLGSRLAAGQRLLPGDTLVSASAKLTMRADGNLVITSAAGKTLWSTGTASDNAFALLTAEGNLVVRNAADTTTLWESRTTAPGGTAVLTDRGGFTLYNAQNQSQWSSGTVVRNDFDGDGRSDMVDWYDYPDGSDAMHMFNGAADGALQAPHTAFKTDAGNWNHDAMKKVSGDFNGDGRTDVAVMYRYADKSSKLWTFLGQANGTFAKPFSSWSAPAASWDQTRARLHAGDFNGDGRDDIAAWYDYTGGKDTLFTFTANARGGFGTPVTGWSADNSWTAAMAKYVTGDFNGDGRDDLAALYDYAGGSVKMWTFPGTPGGGLGTPVQSWRHDTWGDWASTDVHAGDFDGDGRDDVAFWYDYSDGRDIVYVLKSNAGGTTFANPKAALTMAAGTVTYPAMKMVVADYNGDGLDDLGTMYGYTDGNVKMWTWAAKADTTFATAKLGWASPTAKSWTFASAYFLDRSNG